MVLANSVDPDETPHYAESLFAEVLTKESPVLKGLIVEKRNIFILSTGCIELERRSNLLFIYVKLVVKRLFV